MTYVQKLHILNGDALYGQFPDEIPGERIVMKECLVEGPVSAKPIDVFYEQRAEFLYSSYDIPHEKYFEKTVPQINRMLSIDEVSEVNLWFEDDLFCQINLWFVLHHLSLKKNIRGCFLIRPPQHDQYGFGRYPSTELFDLYQQRMELSDLVTLGQIWTFYSEGLFDEIEEYSQKLPPEYDFASEAIKALIESRPSANSPGRPIQTIREIIRDLGSEKFDLVFSEFSKRESIYGFGDLQVKRLLNMAMK